MFRVAAASSVAVWSPRTPGLAAALVHQFDPKMAEAHYNRAGSNRAAAALPAVIEKYLR
jgi:hypothetical protein